MRASKRSAVAALAAAVLCSVERLAHGEQQLLDVLFMADIGHARGNAAELTSPWPMGKSAHEGAFSLYEGLRDYVENQGARPQAVFIVGDVAYGGGSAKVLNHTRDAFQQYLKGSVHEGSVFPVIGNHDIHYLGCSKGERDASKKPCYYGSAEKRWESQPQLTFQQWQSNWLTAFPGLRGSAISPPSSEPGTNGAGEWVAPTRYNLDLDPHSSVYIIAGLISGAEALIRTKDSPRATLDAAAEGGAEVECNFLRDSIAHGRSLGKTVFIYMTHHFRRSCYDWSLIRQIDVWISGHKHNYWQNIEGGGRVVQEERNYPARILIGNGGFDQGLIDVVSFGHLREEVYGEGSNARVRVHLDIKDTCISAETCPSSSRELFAHCWWHCKKQPGGYDGGGGPRKATPSKHGFGFTVDAPRRQAKRAGEKHVAALAGTWKMQVSQSGIARWLALGRCKSEAPSSALCLAAAGNESDAAVMTFYDISLANASVRIAVEDDVRGPILLDTKSGALLRDRGFWSVKGGTGVGLMRPSDGWAFGLTPAPTGWRLADVAWQRNETKTGSQLIHQEGHAMDLILHAAALPGPARHVKSATLMI